MNSVHPPRSSHHHNQSAHNSTALQLQDISHLPITYPSPTSSVHQHHQEQVQPQQKRSHIREEEYIEGLEDEGDDDDDEWEVDREYVHVGAEDTYDNYDPVRPRPIHRESQDVEFGNRITPMRGQGRGRTSIRLPHMMHMKGLQRGKTAILKTLRGGLHRANVSLHGYGHTRSGSWSGSGHSPPYAFEFRDPQPAPPSIRQQYAELASPEPAATVAASPTDASAKLEATAPATHEMRTQNGLLAPPVPVNGPNPSQPSPTTTAAPSTNRRTSLTGPVADADSQSVQQHYHSRSATSHSRRNSIHTIRPRSRSVGSRRSAVSTETVVAPHGSTQMHGGQHRHDQGEDEGEDDEDTAETTLVHHVDDLTLTPIHHSPSKSSSKHSEFPAHGHRHSHSHVLNARFPRPHPRHSRVRTPLCLGRYTSKTKASVTRAVRAFNGLPWMAAPEDKPGALIPSDYYPTPRIAKDFVPARSDRAKLRGSVSSVAGVVYKRRGALSEELADEDGNGSWYRPSSRQVQRNLRGQQYREQHRARVLGAGAVGGIANGVARPMKQVYATYRAVAGRGGRPLDYMYAPSLASGPSAYSPRQHSHSTRNAYAYARRDGARVVPRMRSIAGSVDREVGAALYGVESRPGSIAAAASAYLTRSASTSQAGSIRGGIEYAGSSGVPPAPPLKSAGGETTGLQRSRSYTQTQTQPQSQAQAQSRQQPAYGYGLLYTTSKQSQIQTQGHPVQYYTYNFAYPQPGTRAPGSSPPLPPIPVAASSYAASRDGSIPTIPTNVDRSESTETRTGSEQVSSTSEYSYTRPHMGGQGREHGREHGHKNRYEKEHDYGRGHRREGGEHEYGRGHRREGGEHEYSRGHRREDVDHEYGRGHKREGGEHESTHVRRGYRREGRDHDHARRHGHNRGYQYMRDRGGGGHVGRSASGSSADSGYGTVVQRPVGVASHSRGAMTGRHADYAYPTYVR